MREGKGYPTTELELAEHQANEDVLLQSFRLEFITYKSDVYIIYIIVYLTTYLKIRFYHPYIIYSLDANCLIPGSDQIFN